VAKPGSKRRAFRPGTLEDFDFSFQRSIKRDVIAHLGTLDFTAEANNVVFLGPVGRG
jgi:DNA replication protein DnaC